MNIGSLGGHQESIMGAQKAAAAMDMRPGLREQLEQRRSALKHQLEQYDLAIAALEENPAVEKVLEMLQKVL